MTTDTRIRELRDTPSMLPLMLKAVVRAGVKPGKEPSLPAIGARLTDVVADSKHLAAYRKVCGFAEGDTLPVTYPHMHAHPLFMTLILDDQFPFAAMGLVHIRNRITQYRRIGVREQLDVESRFGELVRTEKGYEFSIVTSVSTGGELVWESESFMLRRGGGSGGDKAKTQQPQPEPVQGEQWQVPGDTGRRYGAVSGDRNPIHLYPLTAKLFGFKRQIVHGMWSKARCLAALDDQLPKGGFTVDVQFKLPMFIPAKVRFWHEKQGDDLSFKLVADDGIKPHLSGEITPAE